jgi:hypothetical protein
MPMIGRVSKRLRLVIGMLPPLTTRTLGIKKPAVIDGTIQPISVKIFVGLISRASLDGSFD